MKISVIIPTHNRAGLLLRAIKSIKNQSHKVDEIIVIDDGSTDNTKDIVKDLHVRYIYQKNSGVSSARNLGIKEAKNEWLAFLDSDDEWHEDKISLHVDLHVNNPNLLSSYTDEKWMRNSKEIKLKTHLQKEEPTFENSLKTCKIGASTFFTHKSVFKDVGMFDEELKVCEDYDLWLRILKKYPIKYIDKKLTIKYAGHENQLSFSTFSIDLYRVEALKKHLNSKFKSSVENEIKYKLDILLKGAKKHNNIEIINYCKMYPICNNS